MLLFGVLVLLGSVVLTARSTATPCTPSTHCTPTAITSQTKLVTKLNILATHVYDGLDILAEAHNNLSTHQKNDENETKAALAELKRDNADIRRQQKVAIDALLKNINELVRKHAEQNAQLNNLTTENAALKSDIAGLKSQFQCDLYNMENRIKEWTLQVKTGRVSYAWTRHDVSVTVVMDLAAKPVTIPHYLVGRDGTSGRFPFKTKYLGKLKYFILSIDSTDGWYGTATLHGRGEEMACGDMDWLDTNESKNSTRVCSQWIRKGPCH